MYASKLLSFSNVFIHIYLVYIRNDSDDCACVQKTESVAEQSNPDSPMSPLAAYQSACQPQGPPPVHTRTKDGDSLKVCTLL